jgi:hypothetical protein
MFAFRIKDQDAVDLVGLGARVLLLAPEGEDLLETQIAGFGGWTDRETELYSALSALIDDPAGWDVFIMATDGFGGIEAARRAHRMLGVAAERVPMIAIGADCRTQQFPDDRSAPIVLRAPATAVSLRVGMDHALRGRTGWRRT